MASSQVEIATFVHNRRDPPTCNFQNNRIEFADLWVHRPQWQTPPPSDSDNNNKNVRIHKAHNKWAKAREMVLNVDHKPSAAASPVVTNSGAVSSLLQKWRGFEAKKADPGPTTPTSPMFQMDNVIAAANAHDPPSPSPSPSLYGDVDSFLGDWEPDRAAAAAAAAVSAPPAASSRSRKAIEIERLKVSDIVKRLTVSTPRGGVSSSSSDQSDQQRCPSPVVSSPRIRGRQALNDLLMRIERDRKKELEGIVARKPVSNFSHRGRIQALLRFRFLLRGGMEAKQDCHSNVDSFQTQKPIQRVKPSVQEVVENTCTAKNESKTSPVKTTDKIHDSAGSETPKQHDDVGKSSQKPKEATSASVRLCHSYEDLGHAENPFSALIRKRPDWENDDHKQLVKSAGNEKEEEGTNQKVTINDFEELKSYQKDEPTQELADTTSMYWASDRASNPDVEWDEFQSDNREWMYQVSRPRSDWEGLRQERYQEMLDHFLDNEEIRVLLGRRSVSTFLSSSHREKIEQVMVSRAQGGHAQQTPKNDRTKEKEKHEINLSEQVGELEEQNKGDDYNDGTTFDEYEEAYESSVGQQYNNESDDSADKITTSSWPQNQSSDYSYHHHQIPSPSPQESPSNFYSQSSSRRPDSSDSARPSAIDMELIYDLRGHMEQLHQEMSELRKSIKSCVDMQIELQRSIKKEVATAMHGGNSEGRNGRRNAVKKVSSTRGRTGGMCCVCHKMPVDSLLYRCGHMCTCFKCAHKLHWSSGKCPICRAPILDVVRTYSNHS